MNKSLITNIIASFFIFFGLASNVTYAHDIFIIGLFALSGAITNALAVHMLFEKVPFLYGSGVVENRFSQFKLAIHALMMNEFFTKENLEKFFESELTDEKSHFDFTKLLDKTDFSPAYDSLKTAVMESSFGGMLGMFGGEAALEPLKEPFTIKLKSAMNSIVHTQAFQQTLHENIQNSNISDDIYKKVDLIVNKRLDELTPKMVKEIIQKMIREHLGWLVVWGGVFGGLIGLISTIVGL